jgi:mRNA-degrading endonuclease YafQ of YafQ-DinJ toxin-antitoxin module
MLIIIYSEKFISQLEKLSPKFQRVVLKKIEIFKVNQRHPSLNTHKLNGVLNGYFSFSVDYQTRIVFEYGTKDTVHFLKIGNHDIYR